MAAAAAAALRAAAASRLLLGVRQPCSGCTMHAAAGVAGVALAGRTALPQLPLSGGAVRRYAAAAPAAAAAAQAEAGAAAAAVPKRPAKPVPAPRNGMTHAKFLEIIGRDCSKAADQIKDWETLFTANTRQLKAMGVKTQQRKWILAWVEKYRYARRRSSGKRRRP